MSLLAPQRRPIVLVVDDAKANRELLEGQLEGLGYEVRQRKMALRRLR